MTATNITTNKITITDVMLISVTQFYYISHYNVAGQIVF
jgi:hypothetical protein